jgi:hypothetical protein
MTATSSIAAPIIRFDFCLDCFRDFCGITPFHTMSAADEGYRRFASIDRCRTTAASTAMDRLIAVE